MSIIVFVALVVVAAITIQTHKKREKQIKEMLRQSEQKRRVFDAIRITDQTPLTKLQHKWDKYKQLRDTSQS